MRIITIKFCAKCTNAIGVMYSYVHSKFLARYLHRIDIICQSVCQTTELEFNPVNTRNLKDLLPDYLLTKCKLI